MIVKLFSHFSYLVTLFLPCLRSFVLHSFFHSTVICKNRNTFSSMKNGSEKIDSLIMFSEGISVADLRCNFISIQILLTKMNRKRLAVMMGFLITNALLESCYCQRRDRGGDHHHRHHDRGDSGGRGVLGGLGNTNCIIFFSIYYSRFYH